VGEIGDRPAFRIARSHQRGARISGCPLWRALRFGKRVCGAGPFNPGALRAGRLVLHPDEHCSQEPGKSQHLCSEHYLETQMGKYFIAWLLGVPALVLVVFYFFFR
jgi:hypothetical protein